MSRGLVGLTAILVASTALPWPIVAQEELEAQNCAAAPRPASPEEAAFLGVGDLERLSWPEDRSPVSDAQLRAAAAPWRGAPLDITTVRCVGLAMERAFREAGYPFVRVSAPPQNVSNGRVRYQVVEGWVERVAPTGEHAGARLNAHRRLRALEPGDQVRPLSLRELERGAALLDEAPGLNARLAVTRGVEDNPGAVRIVADAAPEPRRFVVNFNNYGAEALGRSGASALFSTPGRAPLGDEFAASAYTTFDLEEQHAVRITYRRALTVSGLEMHIDAAYGEAEPGGPVRVLGAAAESFSARFMLTHPVYFDQTSRITAGVGFDLAEQEGDLFGGQVQLSDDSSRNIFARIEAETVRGCDRFTRAPEGACWRLAGELEVRQGVDVLGASEQGDAFLSRPAADPQASVVRAGAEIETPDGIAGVRARLNVRAQVSGTPLLAFEEMTFGNYTSVRGYDPGALAGDSGVSASLDVIGPEIEVRGVSIEPFAFYDAGRAWNEDPGAPNGRFISSYGAGVRVEVTDDVRLEAAWARPVHAPLGLGESQPSSRVLVSMTTNIAGLIRRRS